MDIAIVGAGPAGAWAAYRLARAGAHVTLFDPSHPREKPCGGGVTGRAIDLVAHALGRPTPGVTIRSARLRTSDGRSAVVPLRRDSASREPLVVASRREFDRALLDAATAAGATLETSRVRDVSRTNGCWSLMLSDGRTITAERIIGADGANSLVRRRVVAPFRRDQLSIATGYFAEGATSDEIVLEILTDPPGYLWSFPRRDHIAIGIGAHADAGIGAEALRLRARLWIDEVRLAPAARLVPYSWPIPTLSAGDFASLAVGGDRWLLAGDAAGLVDPLTREGIYFALRSGDLAASAVLDSDNTSSVYRARIHDEIVPELARAARYKAGFFRPRFVEMLFDALVESDRIRSVFADLVAGAQSYRSLKWRLVKTGEWRLAWNALMKSGALDRSPFPPFREPGGRRETA